jgi:hypothetical protein
MAVTRVNVSIPLRTTNENGFFIHRETPQRQLLGYVVRMRVQQPYEPCLDIIEDAMVRMKSEAETAMEPTLRQALLDMRKGRGTLEVGID